MAKSSTIVALHDVEDLGVERGTTLFSISTNARLEDRAADKKRLEESGPDREAVDKAAMSKPTERASTTQLASPETFVVDLVESSGGRDEAGRSAHDGLVSLVLIHRDVGEEDEIPVQLEPRDTFA